MSSSSPWRAIGALMGLPEVLAVEASPRGWGVVSAALTEAGGGASSASTVIVRVTETAIDVVHEGPGFVEYFNGVDDQWVAVQNVVGDQGSVRRLLRSNDAGRSWSDAGPIPLTSVTGLVMTRGGAVLVHGGRRFCSVSSDGRDWVSGELPVGPTGAGVRIVRDGHDVAMIGMGGFRTSSDLGASWSPAAMDGADVHGIDGQLVLGGWHGLAGLAERGSAGAHVGFPDRYPMRMARAGGAVQVLTRGLDPAAGTDVQLHRSPDEGASWTHHSLNVTARCAVAGAHWGLGVDLAGRVHVAQLPNGEV